MEIGFIGLGHMGAAMAGRLIAAGHKLKVWNRDRAKLAPLVEQGAEAADTPAQAARAGVVFTMLSDDDALRAVTEGEEGILAAGEGVLHVSSSTVSVAVTRALAEAHRGKGQRLVSAQVLGRPDVAQAGALSIIAAGSREDLARVGPLFEAIGQKTLTMGERPEMAAAAKLATNVSIAMLIEMVSEAYRIAGAHGVPAETMLDLFTETNFGSRMIGIYGRIIAEQRQEGGFPLRLGRKDVRLGLEAAGDQADLPFARIVAERMDAIIAAGGEECDWSALGQETAKA